MELSSASISQRLHKLMDSVPPVMWNPFSWIQHELTPRTPLWKVLKNRRFGPLNFIVVSWILTLQWHLDPLGCAGCTRCLRQTSHDAKGIHYLQGCKVASKDLRWCQRNSYVWTWRVSCSTSPNLRFQIRKLEKNNCDIGSFKTTRL